MWGFFVPRCMAARIHPTPVLDDEHVASVALETAEAFRFKGSQIQA